MIKKSHILLLLFFLCGSLTAQTETPYSKQNQLNLNHAGFEEIAKLPVSEELARLLYERVLYRGYFKSIFELLQIPGVTQEIFENIKPLIRIEPFQPLTTVQEKIEHIYYRLDRWSSGEGVNDAFIDLWIEKALDPMNVNNARYNELVNLQNVSPIDAVAILNHRKEVHWIRDERDLRRTPGLSNYAFRTARYFLDYKDSQVSGWHGNFMIRTDNTPFMADEEEQAEESGISAIAESNTTGYNFLPNLYYKSRFSYGQNIKFGFSFDRRLNEPTYYLDDSRLIPDGKFYFGIENLNYRGFYLRKLYVGNYSVTFGQGVIMENTDFFTPRKSGYGFRKRFKGISGDNSRTREYSLRGIAAEGGYKNFSALGFFSFNDRDAIINRNEYSASAGRAFNHFIVLEQRFPYAPDDSLRAPGKMDIGWLNSVKEFTYGWHLQYDFLPGTYLGFSYYESAYDRMLDPDPYEIVGQDYAGVENWERRQSAADVEIKQAYGGAVARGENFLWSDAVSFRRVYGFDFQTVIKNIAIQGEYGELEKGGSFYKMGDDPKALVLSAYLQYPTFNILALYRNYDIGFDNPYQRSFSNNRRYKGTIFDRYYYLQSALYGQLYASNPQPQAEEGLFLSSYYQINRQITTRLQYDNWMRNSDYAKQYRLVGTINYRPIFPLTIQLRNKWQAREEQNDLTSNLFYKNLEFRGHLRMRLSGYDNLEIMYVTGKLIVHPRPRVFGDMTLNAEAIAAVYTHNFNKNLKVNGMLSYYQGFFWNFEDTQFVVMNSKSGAIRYWLSMYMRLNSNFAVRMKYTAEHHKPISNVAFEPYPDTLAENPDKRFTADWLRKYDNIFYMEFNYNF